MHCLLISTFQRIYLFQLNSNHKHFTGHRSKLVHSGITKACSEKSYHVHLSDDKNHQFFVHLALTNMINNAKAPDYSYIVTESDNCKV